MQQTTPDYGPRGQDTRPTFLRLPAVMKETGLGRTTIYRLISERRFPPPFRLSTRAVGWRRVDIDAWSDTRAQADH
ncbi:hypothetical protein CKO44_00350 [Rubrivivax gelatinosus]|uniref:AlpA family transcriptional regulator n=1 Tax=Rubrivivax gelatinosus TaxID=28068 RepID=A0ABS1DNP6_RUBGE|nr:AlpA family transcriptional regulator [Rubrivivax gelatinosus]MBK1611920.1 hypothetical protein [Rubrivivax gelatinosus]MBK1711576.1 hypothetical protein [Rubrivivax gelatinosus]